MNKKNTIDKYLNLILNFILIFLITITFYLIYKIYNLLIVYDFWISPLIQFYIFILILLILLLISFKFIFQLDQKYKNNLSIFFLSSIITIYSLEIINEIIFPTFNAVDGGKYIEKIKKKYSKKNNITLDNRTIYEFISDYRKKNIESYPNFKPNLLIKHIEDNSTSKNYNNGFKINDGKILPLSNISNIITTTGNEGGFYPIIKTDKYGFNNSNKVYESRIDVVLVGDSFVEGSDVRPINNISSNLIKENFNTLNLGKSHSGPLVQFAIFKEYAISHKPKKVFWFYFANDHKDLTNEINSDLLLKYLYDYSFSQKLKKKQIIIDRKLKHYFNIIEKNYIKNEDKNENYYSINYSESLTLKRIIRVFKLFNLRNRLGLLIDMKPIYADSNQMKIQENIIKSTNKIIESWNGELIFVLIPQYTKDMAFLSQELDWVVETNVTSKIIKILNKNHIKFINLEEHIDNHNDPLSLYPFRIPIHFNEKGYLFIADILTKELKAE